MTLGKVAEIFAAEDIRGIRCDVEVKVGPQLEPWCYVTMVVHGGPTVVCELQNALQYERDMAQIRELAKRYNIDAGRLEALVNGEKGHDAT